ncbi:MAG: [Muribaculaceae bacterium]|nr:[FeFe] hydrogenase H-cluster maturation GTPase HydF [Muribaculaceae bacterium]
MNHTPSSHRVHIAFYGRCNSGKSSLINALTGQEVAIVSAVAGTTTDPVSKPIELPNIGATILIDTPGIDDNTTLGEQRKAQTLKTLNKTDIAVVLFNDTDTSIEQTLIAQLKAREIPVIGVISKCDTIQNRASFTAKVNDIVGPDSITLSATTKEGIDQLLARLASLSQQEQRLITEGLCNSGDMVVLVMPQDAQAPKGRLIKPQVEVIRELLDRGCNTLCTTPEGLQSALNALNTPPQLIITDSQVFAPVHKIVEEYRNEVASSTPQSQQNAPLLTSFSILFARYKGDIDTFVEGGKKLLSLTSSSRVLIAEACSHIPQNEDIGRVKLPRMLRNRIGNDLQIDIVGGNDFPVDLSQYDLVIHCGACMFNSRLVMSRIAQAQSQDVPITNYGIALATLTGIINKVAY